MTRPVTASSRISKAPGESFPSFLLGKSLCPGLTRAWPAESLLEAVPAR
jgi:hypothetical protein